MELNNQDNAKKIGMTTSIVFHTIVLLLFFFIKCDPPSRSLGDANSDGGNNIEIDFGNTPIASGNNPVPDETEPAPEVPNIPDPEPIRQPKVEPKTKPSEPTKEDAKLTADNNEISLNKKKEEKIKKEQEKQQKIKEEKEQQRVAEEIKKAKEAAEQDKKEREALASNFGAFGKNRKGTGAGGSGANQTGGGKQGSPNGTNNQGGRGLGDNLSPNLSQRGVKRACNESFEYQKQGVVTLSICVDKTGKVVRSSTDPSRTTTVDPDLLEIANRCARNYEFNADEDATTEECGKLKLTFILK